MSAIISDCGQYRYTLDRPGDLTATTGPALFIMLNPSTADANQDDPTIRRCRNFARSWGCNGIRVVNLYAYRATKPAELWIQADPVGPVNDTHIQIQATLPHVALVICAWGANANAKRAAAVYDLISAAGVPLYCLGTTKHGHPRHPLYVRGDQRPVEYRRKGEDTP